MEEPEEPTPPSPPPPGRRPGRRTRSVPPSDRRTRSQVPEPATPPEPNDPAEVAEEVPTPEEPSPLAEEDRVEEPAPETPPQVNDNEPRVQGGNEETEQTPRKRLFSNPRRGNFSFGNTTTVPQQPPSAEENLRSVPTTPKTFSKPTRENFSFKRISYAAPLAAIIKKHVGTE